MQYNVISGDSHVDMTWMPGDLWVSQAPAKFRAVAPHVVETDEGLKWTAEGKTLGVFGGSSFGFGKAQRGASKRIDTMFDEGFYEGPPRPTTPELRLKDMEMDGVDAEVLYGILGVGMRFDDPELTRYVYNVYYEWAAEFCNTNPGRWAALAPLASHDPQAAAADLRTAAKLGLKGADFAVSIAVKPLYQQEWDVLWEAASECAMPVSFHFTVGMRPSIRQPDPEDLPAYKSKLGLVSDACSQLEGALHLTSIIYSGACERYPNFKWVLGESGVTWVPFLLARMDAHRQDARHQVTCPCCPASTGVARATRRTRPTASWRTWWTWWARTTRSGDRTTPTRTACGPTPNQPSNRTLAGSTNGVDRRSSARTPVSSTAFWRRGAGSGARRRTAVPDRSRSFKPAALTIFLVQLLQPDPCLFRVVGGNRRQLPDTPPLLIAYVVDKPGESCYLLSQLSVCLRQLGQEPNRPPLIFGYVVDKPGEGCYTLGKR